MAVELKTYNDWFTTFKAHVQDQFPLADFNEGSFWHTFGGALSLAAMELQARSFQEFSWTFFLNPATTAARLETLAEDHFGPGAIRPEAAKAQGVLIVTRKTGDDITPADITVSTEDTFTSRGQRFRPTEEVTSLAAAASFSIPLEAVESGVAGNLATGTDSDWTHSLQDVTVANADPFLGGAETLNDAQYRQFIQDFIVSLQPGTSVGIEASARLISGVESAKVIKELVSVGTLKPDGTLMVTPSKYHTVLPRLYVFGQTTKVNDAVLTLVKQTVTRQLSTGGVMQVLSAQAVEINLKVKCTFQSTTEALALSQNKTALEEGIRRYVNGLAIGTDFVRANFVTGLLTLNGWTGLFTPQVTLPAGDVTINATQKAVLGTLEILVA